MSFLHNRRILLAIVIILALSLIVVLYAVQQRQEQRSKASQAATLSFEPATNTPLQKNVNDTFSLDLMVNPGINQVSFVKVRITYDATKFEVVPNGLVVNTTAFPVTAEDPSYSSGLVAASYTIGTDPANAIKVPTKVATLTLKAKATTNGAAASIGFDPQTQILSVAPTDQANENVLSSTTPALVIINQLASCPSNPGVGDIMMIVDVSGSTIDNRSSQKTAMKTFVDNVAASTTNGSPYSVGLVSYASRAVLNSSLQNGTDYTSLKSAIDTMPFIDNASAGEDEAITLASQQLHTFGRTGIRKVIVILTDRIDSYAQKAIDADFALNHTAYYVIAYDISNSTIRRNLQALAADTGGTYSEYKKSGGPTENQILSDVAGQVSCPQTTPVATAAPTITPSATPTPTRTPTPTATSPVCLQVMTYARNSTSKVCQTFPTSCLPTGWVKDPTCAPTPTPTRIPFQVTNITVSASPTTITTSCPAVITFTAKIITNGPGTVQYQWLRSDNSIAPVKTIQFTAAGTKQVSVTWTLGTNTNPNFKPFRGSQQLKIISPNALFSNKAEFTLSCVASPTATPIPPTLTFTGNPLSIAYNASSTLSWSTTNATSCTASGAWTGTKATSGTLATDKLTATNIYTLSCNGAGGKVVKSVTIAVAAPTNTPIPTKTPTHTPTPTPQVTNLTTSVKPSSSTTSCPGIFTFTGTITVNAPTTVTYTWLRSDNAISPVKSISFTAAGSKTVTTTWTLGSNTSSLFHPFNGWEAVKILSPNSLESNHASFSLNCQAPTPTIKILPTATPIPTTTAVPTLKPLPTNTPVPNHTMIALSLELHGIGISGDNQNPNPEPCQKATFSATDCLLNQNPVHPQRPIDITVFTNSTNAIAKTGTLTYNPVTGLFKAVIDLGANFVTDDYSVYVHTGKYLSKIISGQHITQGVTTPILKTAFVTGDANGDNSQSILDYTLLMGCYETPQTPAKACNGEKAQATDFNDDGVTNQYDYNLFLRDLATHNGDQLPF